MDALPSEDQFTSILPYEIVEYIFRLACPSVEWGGHESDHLPSQNVPLLLSHVSKSWRSFVHAAPLLWTNICIHKRSSNPEMLRQILHYSKDCSLTACIVLCDTGDLQWISICMKELFRHAHQIRSFRLDVRFREGLWSEDAPWPPFPMLEDIKTLGGPNSEQDSARLYPLFDSPQLRNVSWLSDDQFPAPLLRVGAQIKQLTLSDGAIKYTDVVGLLKACPNVVHLNVFPGGPYRPILNSPIRPACLYPLFNSAQLQGVTWLCYDRFPESLLQIASIKELIIPNVYINSAETSALLQACPNLTHLEVFPTAIELALSSPIYLRDLHTLHTTEAGIHLCIAPNLRRLTLRLDPEIYDAIHLLQFLSLSPRLEHLNLEIRGEEMSDDLIIQIIPLAPCLVALEFNFMSVPGVWVFNELFEMLSRIGPSTSVLPKLQHLTLNVNHFDDDRNAPPLVYETERLLHMLESRSSPQILYPA